MLGTYLGLSPVYWWPNVPVAIFAGGKFCLVFLVVIFIWSIAMTKRDIPFPGGVLGIAGLFLLLVLSVSGIAQSEESEAFLRIKDYLLSFIMMWTCYYYQRMNRDISKVFYFAGLIIAIHCAIVICSKVMGFPRWSGPKGFYAPELWISGFTGLRTGWSDGGALFVPVLAGYFLGTGKIGFLKRVIALLGVISIIGSQIVVAGKAGILASITGIMLLLLVSGKKKYLVVYLVVLAIVAIGVRGYMYKAVHIENYKSQRNSFGKLDKFSAGRVSGDIMALKSALEQPLQGYGFREVLGSHVEIHNLWLRMWIESGLLLPLGFAYIVFRIYRTSSALSRKTAGRDTISCNSMEVDPLCYYGRVVIFSGILISMFEPRFLLGSFQQCAIWWAVAGACISATTSSYEQRLGSPALELDGLGGHAITCEEGRLGD